MNTLYRVEAHDDSGWNFAIRIDQDSKMPRFCSLPRASIGSRDDIEVLMERALRLCGGTLRIAEVPAALAQDP